MNTFSFSSQLLPVYQVVVAGSRAIFPYTKPQGPTALFRFQVWATSCFQEDLGRAYRRVYEVYEAYVEDDTPHLNQKFRRSAGGMAYREPRDDFVLGHFF